MLSDRKFRSPRKWSNRELARIAPEFSGSVVNVSAGDDEDKEGSHYAAYFSGASEYHLTNYMPGAFRGYKARPNEHYLDLQAAPPNDLRRRFDVVLSHTVLEHVFDVFQAFRNTCELSKDVVVIVVPFAQVQHESSSYEDFWRFTPRCLRRLFASNEMSVVYESWNTTPGTSVYIISVGARNPEKWLDAFGEKTERPVPAEWLGRSAVDRVRQLAGSCRTLLKTFR